MSKETLALILGVIGGLLVIDGSISLARFVVSLCKRKMGIIITSEELEVLEDALACSELSWRDLLTENPEACNEDEVNREIAKIRKLSSDFISVLQDSSSVVIEVSK